MTALQALRDALPSREVHTDPDVMASYARDQASLCPAGVPLAVVLARSEATVAATLRVAHAHGVPVVSRGAGTGLSGGANAIDGCIVLSLAKMSRILELDPVARMARVEPGVLNGHLDAAAREHGLVYAPDPASRDISTIGGNVATNAGGACCLKYGVTGDHVVALRALLADGTPIHTGARTRKNVAGLDLTRLLVGSEGALAVITEVTVRLMPKPQGTGTLVAFFDRLEDVGAVIVELAGWPELSAIEVMDRVTVRAVEAMRQMELDTEAAAMLLVGCDDARAEAILTKAQALCEARGASLAYATADADEGALLMQARSAALPALERQGQWLLDDVAVPVARVPDLLRLCADIGEETGLTIGTFGHAGDGNLHPTILYDGASSGGRQLALEAFDRIVAGALQLGGSITGEHGVGTLKRPYLERMVGEAEVALMGRVKAAFDPTGILNPGKGL